MKEVVRKYAVSAFAVTFVLAGLVVAFTVTAAGPGPSANGQGTLMRPDGRRSFSFSAQIRSDGSVTGQANLHSHEYAYGNGNQPYMVQIDISCMKVVGNTAWFGGMPRRTNETDPVYSDAVFFGVQDNGEPGKGRDKVTLAYFWDDQPPITGDPQACQNLPAAPVDGTALITIDSGNVQVKP